MKRTKEQYLDLLRYYFRKAKSEDLQEILSDHEEHFLSGCEQGLSDEEIIKALGHDKINLLGLSMGGMIAQEVVKR